MPSRTQSQPLPSTYEPKQIIDLEIDITAYLCPMTFVRTRLALDRLQSGQILAIRLKGEEPRINIPKTAMEQGHEILATTELPGNVTLLLVRKGSGGLATP